MSEKIVTSCLDCVFAQWDDNEQVGCDFDRLDKFEENGAEVVGHDGETKKWFTIEGRFCNACRDHDWGKRHQRREWKSLVEEATSLKVAILIYVDDSTSVEEVARTLDSVVAQEHPPNEIVIALHNPPLEERSYVNLVRSMDLKIPWFVKRVNPEQVLGYNESIAHYIALDLALASVSSTYYCLVCANHELPSNFLKTVNNAVNVEMMRFVALLPDDDGNRLVIQSNLHKVLWGNRGKSIIEKIEEIAKEEKTEHMVKRYEDLPVCE